MLCALIHVILFSDKINFFMLVIFVNQFKKVKKGYL